MLTEFDISNMLREKGISKIALEARTIIVEYHENCIRSSVYADFEKTIKTFQKRAEKYIQDKLMVQNIIAIISKNWLKLIENNNENKENVDENNMTVEKLVCSTEEWQKLLDEKMNLLQETINSTFPDLWPPLEFTLSIKNILHIKGCTLPFCGILLGRPSSLKTLSLELQRKRPMTFYTDNFSAKSIVSHNTSVPKEKLKEIDLLPRIRNKCFLTPELAPTFAKKDEELLEILGILTRILDGHGYESDSGAHGHRGYSGQYMFTMIGAAVDIPYKVYKYLATLGPKMYYYRIPKSENSEDDYLNQLRDNDFGVKFGKVQTALFEYLQILEGCPAMQLENGVPKIEWNDKNDEEPAQRMIIKLGKLLGHLRGSVSTWDTKGTQGADYGYSHSTIEDASRAITQLYNLSRGHALLSGRNYITLKDIPILIRVVLSTASIERVSIFDLLLKHNGKLTTNKITESLRVSKPTAHRTMVELKALFLVDMDEDSSTGEFNIKLSQEFDWFLSDEFRELRGGFLPENYHDHLSKEKISLSGTESNHKINDELTHDVTNEFPHGLLNLNTNLD